MRPFKSLQAQGRKATTIALGPYFPNLWLSAWRNGRIFLLTDAQVGAVKLITDVGCAVKFLENLGKLYQAFSVHQKHKRTLQDDGEIHFWVPSRHCSISAIIIRQQQGDQPT